MKKFLKALAIASIILLFIFDILNYSFMQIQIHYLNKHKISYFEYRFPTLYYLLQPSKKTNQYYTRLIKDGFADVVGGGNVKTSRLIRALQKRNRILPHYYDEILYFWNKELAPYNKIHSKKELKHRLYLYEDSNKHTHYYKRTKALHQAKDKASIKALIAQGATINDLNRQQNHILHFVKDSTLAKFIIASGGSINTLNMFKHTPLIEAIKNYQKTKNSEYLKIIKLFLNHRADIRKALKFTQDIEVAKLLIKYGANVNETDSHGISVLHHLLRTNNHTIIEFLIDCGANINHQDNLGRSLLHRTTNPKMITLLLQKGINTNLRNKHGKTALKHWESTYEAMKNYPKNVYKKSHHDAYLKAIETYKEYFNPTQKATKIEPKKVKPTPKPKPKEPKSLIECDTLEEVQKAINNGVNIENKIYYLMNPFTFFITRYHKRKDKKYFEIGHPSPPQDTIPKNIIIEKGDIKEISAKIRDHSIKNFDKKLSE
ncbi:MAG: ankyrin repeat domain-containing protein, partial [Campylobacterota bacterium]|nr:ankyrin repeat domain-containing protein [Campylobacterota bacterium]